MAARDTRRIEKELEIRIAARTCSPSPMPARPSAQTRRKRTLRRRRAAPCVASGPLETHSRSGGRYARSADGGIVERLSNLGDEVDEVLLDDERVGPQAFLKRDLRQRLWAAGDEDLQELNAFGESGMGSSPRRNSRVSGSSAKSPKYRRSVTSSPRGRTSRQGGASRNSSTTLPSGVITAPLSAFHTDRIGWHERFPEGAAAVRQFDPGDVIGRRVRRLDAISEIDESAVPAPLNRDVPGSERRNGLASPPSTDRAPSIPDRPRMNLHRERRPCRAGTRRPA